MKKIANIIQGKNIFYVDGDMTVLEVAKYMSDNNVGAVPVICDDRVCGIFSERDILNRVIVKQLDPSAVKVKDVMTQDLIALDSSDTYDHCLAIMRKKNIRHIPIKEGDKLVGMISLRDILQEEVVNKDEEIEILKNYIYFKPVEKESGPEKR